MHYTFRRFVHSCMCNYKHFMQPNRYMNSSPSKPCSKNKKYVLTSLGVISGGVAALIYTLDRTVKASELELHAPHLPWFHKGLFNTVDHASVRRGYQVYKNVCSACHSLQYVAFRDLIGVCYTEEEAKAEAAERMVKDGPDEDGNMFDRPGKLSDYIPKPYPNMEAARAANNGSFPPDLTYIMLAREGGEDYVFHLIMGYQEAPGGIALKEGQYFNPYFAGGAISMAPPLYSDQIEYDDETTAHASQMAKDICTFLVWASDTDFGQRKKMLIKAIGVFSMLLGVVYYFKCHSFSGLLSRKILRYSEKSCKK